MKIEHIVEVIYQYWKRTWRRRKTPSRGHIAEWVRRHMDKFPEVSLAVERLAAVAAINRPNAGVLIDAIHFDRSNSLVDDIERVPLSQLHYAQICDAPAEKPASEAEIIRAAREERLLPGSGGIPLKEIFSRLPKDLPICVEVPNASLGDSPTRAKAALAATKAFFAKHFGQA